MRHLKKLSVDVAVTSQAIAYRFVRRSFLYLGYANETGRLLMPDYARVPILERVLQREERLRENLIRGLKTTWTQLAPVDYTGVTRLVPALAAIVFDRASPDRRRIPKELRNLRAELASVRKRLREDEFELQSASAPRARRIDEKWKAAVTELNNALGGATLEASVHSAVNCLPEVAGVASAPQDPVKWAKLLTKASVNTIRRVVAPRPTIELYKAVRKTPGPLRLRASVEELFGEIRN